MAKSRKIEECYILVKETILCKNVPELYKKVRAITGKLICICNHITNTKADREEADREAKN